MPGSGKTTLGKQLAEYLKVRFIDLDHEIEKSEESTISEIFNKSGEPYFRQVESKTLHLLANSPEQFVISTGGGAPCFHDGITTINRTGISIFLDVSVGELIRRLEKDQNRPLLRNAELAQKLTSLRETRLPVYMQAQIMLTGDSISLDQITSQLDTIQK